MGEAKPGRIGPIVGGLLLMAVAVALAAWGISTRARALDEVTKETRELGLLSVSVVAPEHGAPQQEIVLPGTMQAFTDASIYARTNGYLKQRFVDIGARVRTGQLLAEIDTPELDQQIAQARADLATAEANARLATTTAERFRDLLKTDSVSRQDVDNANGNLEARMTAVESARANVKRLEQLHAFRRIEAPFDGVITVRNTEIGALIDSGGNAKELFHIAAVNKLRVFINVPQIYSQLAQPGISADLTLKEFSGRTFKGTLARTAQSIDVASRTLLAEIDVDNPKGELLPGSYAEVHLRLATPAPTLKVPVSALIFRAEGLQVATVANDRIRIVPVTAGRDFGSDVEISAGLAGDERVVVNPPDSLVDGVAVRVVTPPANSGGAAR